MEYSLNNLTKVSNVKEWTLTNFVHSLNLIGLEVDAISKEKISSNYILENIILLIKIPANREDLLIETFLIQEFSLVFLFQVYEIWQKFQKSYSFLLKKKYHQSYDYLFKNIETPFSEVIIYGLEIQNFQNHSSPFWIQKKLKNTGIDISKNFNDLMNLILLEWGQSLNLIFDSSLKQEKNVTKYKIERIPTFEIFKDLKENLYELIPGTLVLKNESNQILSVLGIFNQTFSKNNFLASKILIEAVFYDMDQNNLGITYVESKFHLKNFRKICLENFKFSFQRLLTLIEILNYGTILPIKYSTKKKNIVQKFQKILILKKKLLQNILNIQKIDETIFKKAGLKIVCQTKENFFFKIPRYRKDLVREIDLIEEYSRFIGYQNFVEIFPQKENFRRTTKNLEVSFLKQYFLNYGFHEVFTNSITDCKKTDSCAISIANPLNKELSSLRTSLFLKLIEVFSNNLRLFLKGSNFFELGRIFKQEEKKIFEKNTFCAIFQFPFSNSSKEKNIDWFAALGFVENILTNFGYPYFSRKQLKVSDEFFHPTKSIVFRMNEKILGNFGELHPSYEVNFFSKQPIYLLELNLDFLNSSNYYSTINLYKESSKYPTIIKDLSFTVEKTINFVYLKELVENQGPEVKKVTFFDIFFDKKNPNVVNIGLRLEFQSYQNTLTMEEIDPLMKKIRNLLEQEFEAHFRN